MLAEIADEVNAGIMMFTESHLNKDIRDAEVNIENFEMVRADREEHKNGGIVTYIRSELNLGVKILLSLSYSKVEALILGLDSINAILIGVYRPPDTNLNDFTHVLGKIKETVESVNDNGLTILLTGDFNMPHVDWTRGTTHGGTIDHQNQVTELINLTEEYYMEQYILEATRGSNILDLFFSNNDLAVLNVDVQPPTILSDHQLVIVATNFSTQRSTDKVDVKSGFGALNFTDNMINWVKINEDISNVDWVELFESRNATDMYDIFLSEILKICEDHVPVKNRKTRSKIPRDRKVLMRNRAKLKRKLNARNIMNKANLENKIKDIETKIAESHKAELESREECAVRRIKDDPKYFYKYASKKSSLRSRIGPLQTDTGFLYESKNKADALLKQYDKVFNETCYETELLEELDSYQGPRSLDLLVCSSEDVESAISTLSAKSSSGPDGITSLLLLKSKTSISKPIQLILHKSLTTSEIPIKLKFGHVVPVHKGGDKCNVANYRPITLTSHIIKIFEKIIAKHIVQYLINLNLFNKNQHGFIKGRSCLSQLLEHFQNILMGMEDGKEVEVIYLDFSKAFDKIDHKMILMKLLSMGLCGHLLKWIGNFILVRKHSVIVDGVSSDVGRVRSGVPQGSVFGPLLFIIAIVDIDASLTSATASSFADDTRISMQMSRHHDSKVLKDELNRIYDWAELNQMV